MEFRAWQLHAFVRFNAKSGCISIVPLPNYVFSYTNCFLQAPISVPKFQERSLPILFLMDFHSASKTFHFDCANRALVYSVWLLSNGRRQVQYCWNWHVAWRLLCQSFLSTNVFMCQCFLRWTYNLTVRCQYTFSISLAWSGHGGKFVKGGSCWNSHKEMK